VTLGAAPLASDDEIVDQVLMLEEGEGDSSEAEPAAPAGNATKNATAAEVKCVGAACGAHASDMNAIAPPNNKKPEDQHFEANKRNWAQLGGWSTAKEAEHAKASADLDKAREYVKVQEKEKERSEMGCPCEGEKYFEIVQDNPGNLAKALNEPPPPPENANATAPAEKTQAQKEAAADSSFATYKKMLAKYGKPGPNSGWTPAHDKQKNRAAKNLKKAEKLEDKMLTLALPEFKKVKEDHPEVFTNGKCGCPTGFTPQDAAALALKLKDDVVKEAEEMHKMVVKQNADPTYWEADYANMHREPEAKPAAAPAAPAESD